MSHPLDGAWAKYKRAQVHLKRLERHFSAWLNTEPKPYELIPETDVEHNLTLVFMRALRDPPSERWAPMIGDCLHNLHSALDHLAFQLVPESKRNTVTAFPIFERRETIWSGGKGTSKPIRKGFFPFGAEKLPGVAEGAAPVMVATMLVEI